MKHIILIILLLLLVILYLRNYFKEPFKLPDEQYTEPFIKNKEYRKLKRKFKEYIFFCNLDMEAIKRKYPSKSKLFYEAHADKILLTNLKLKNTKSLNVTKVQTDINHALGRYVDTEIKNISRYIRSLNRNTTKAKDVIHFIGDNYKEYYRKIYPKDSVANKTVNTSKSGDKSSIKIVSSSKFNNSSMDKALMTSKDKAKYKLTHRDDNKIDESLRNMNIQDIESIDRPPLLSIYDDESHKPLTTYKNKQLVPQIRSIKKTV
jgi:hypothetical protein